MAAVSRWFAVFSIRPHKRVNEEKLQKLTDAIACKQPRVDVESNASLSSSSTASVTISSVQRPLLQAIRLSINVNVNLQR